MNLFLSVALACGLTLAFTVPASADDAMPNEADPALKAAIQTCRAQQQTPGNIRTSARYMGVKQIDGKNLYEFIVYAHLPERYENLCDYAVSKNGKTIYAYDVVMDEFTKLK